MKLTDYQIAEQAHQLIEGIGEEGISLLAAVEKHLAIVDAPEIRWEMQSVDTGLLQALSGRRRDFLVVSHTRLKEYQVLVSARAYGTTLMATWMLTASPRIGNEIVRAMRFTTDSKSRHDIGAELDTFALIDLAAFSAITRLALKKAIADLTDEEEVGDNEPTSEPEWGPSS